MPTPPPPLVHEPRLGMHRFNVVALGVLAAFAFGALAYAVFHSLPVAVLVGIPAGFGVARLPDLIGRAVASVFFASGRSTPHPAEHSLARALAVQGHLEAALAAYEDEIADDPTDPQPSIEIARLLRDRLDRPAEALLWFRKARGAQRLTPRQDVLVIRELAELCVYRLNEPLRAAPELAQLARARVGTPDGDWARRELDRIRAAALAAGQAPPSPAPESGASAS